MIPKCLQRHFTCLHMHMQHNNNKSCKMQTDSIHTHAHSYSPTYTKTHIPLHIHSKRFHIIFHVYFCFSSDWIIVGKFPIIAWITCVLNRRHYSSTSVRLTLHQCSSSASTGILGSWKIRLLRCMLMVASKIRFNLFLLFKSIQNRRDAFFSYSTSSDGNDRNNWVRISQCMYTKTQALFSWYYLKHLFSFWWERWW